MSILDDIYSGLYEIPHPPGRVPKDVLEQDSAFWAKVEELLGEEAVEAEQVRVGDIGFAEEQNAFREGFRLGALLMLELI